MIMIIGSGVTGLALADYYARKKMDYFFAREEDLKSKSFNKEYLDKLLSNVDLVVTSPGVSLNNELIIQIKKKQIALFGEFDFAASMIKNDIICVTGTNGKTTSVSLIQYLLKDFVNGVKLGGNVGVPVIQFIDRLREEIVVLEASSYQLELVKNFKPHIAIILNISEDHLIRHGSMEEYISCKYNITKNQDENDYLILNADDGILSNSPPNTKAKIYYFSTQEKVVGSYIRNGCIYFNDGEKEIKLVSLLNIKLVGEHNLSNILASVLAVYLQTGDLKLLKNISKFEGVSHRIEYLKTINGVHFYNDSKATNIASTLAAVNSFKASINLILGGSDKGCGFNDLFEKLPKTVKNIAVYGETKYKIALSAKMWNYYNIYICDNLEMATRTLYSLSNTGDIVLLSPACASFDFFSNFEERGNFFKSIVKDIELNEGS